MKLNAVIFLIVFGFFNAANASIAGKWIGWAYWKFDGEGPKCTAHMIFNETLEKFSYLMGDIDCDLVTMSIPEKHFNKSATGELLLDGVVVGKWTENTFEWTERYNERTIVNVNIKVNGSNIDYVEHWIEDESTLLYEITGRLFKTK